MSQIEIDINDWRIKSHLPDALWQRYADGRLRAKETEALQSHLLMCPCCQEQLTAGAEGRRTEPLSHAVAA